MATGMAELRTLSADEVAAARDSLDGMDEGVYVVQDSVLDLVKSTSRGQQPGKYRAWIDYFGNITVATLDYCDHGGSPPCSELCSCPRFLCCGFGEG